MANDNFFDNADNDQAFNWLTLPGSMQAAQLENAMRNYAYPVYDPADVGEHLLKALAMPMAGYNGSTTKVDVIPLAIAIISHADTLGWNVVEEIGWPR